jgi:hypothetical protein
MSEITRRDALTRLASAFAATAAIDYALGSELHAALQGTRGAYMPAALSAQQFRTLEVLTDLIIPVDNGKPGALQAGVPAWIDQLLNVNAELKQRYVAGLTWLDTAAVARGSSMLRGGSPTQTGGVRAGFSMAPVSVQTGILDQIAYKKNATPELTPGIEFFALARRMTVDGFYTSEVGVRDLIPQGRPPMPRFEVPQAAVDYVISRSPFK